MALVLFVENWAPFLRGSTCWVYLDSNNSLAALVGGGSNTEVIAISAVCFWHLVQTYDICPWLSRVRSEINPSDLPTHRELLPYTPRRVAAFENSTRLFALGLSQMAFLSP